MLAVEGTGCYGAGLCRTLQAAGLQVVEMNRPDRSTRRWLGKDDTIDAEAAARSYIAGKATVIPKAGDDLVEMIRMLKVVKGSATENRTAALNQLHAIVVTAPAALRERLQRLKGKELVECSVSLRSGEINTPLAAAKMALRTLARRIQHLEQELKDTLAQLDQLTMKLCPELRNTYGVGVDISATLVVAVGDNQERMKSEASFAALCGVNPLPASSGKGGATPAEPQRQPPGQLRPAPHRHLPAAAASADQGVRRAPHRRRPHDEGDHPLPQAVCGPRSVRHSARWSRRSHGSGLINSRIGTVIQAPGGAAR